jgi:23S rRNA (cytidine1920-2'-O)/16S rRNA (cytidine1409-2'-O)-methyltransferase
MARFRLDALVKQKKSDISRNKLQAMISGGGVLVNGKPITRPGVLIEEDADIEIIAEAEPRYVSRAGEKLEHALKTFGLEVKGMVALDAGVSTGGFSDCLLQHGVKKIYGVDVGHGQADEKICSHSRVALIENTNVRYLETLPEKVDLVTLDLSFISVLKVIPAVSKLIKPTAKIIILIKPQFESEPGDIKKSGKVRGKRNLGRAVKKVKVGMEELGFKVIRVVESPLEGATSGNKEFLGLFEKA